MGRLEDDERDGLALEDDERDRELAGRGMNSSYWQYINRTCVFAPSTATHAHRRRSKRYLAAPIIAQAITGSRPHYRPAVTLPMFAGPVATAALGPAAPAEGSARRHGRCARLAIGALGSERQVGEVEFLPPKLRFSGGASPTNVDGT